jgi:GTP-binding protein HflX
MVDISSDNFEEQKAIVEETLKEIGAENKPVVLVFNKVDKLDDESSRELLVMLRKRYPESVFISAEKGINLGKLEERISEVIDKELDETEIKIPIGDSEAYKIVNELHKTTEILETKYLNKSIKLKIRANRSELDKIIKSINHRKAGKSNETIH